MCSNAEIRCSQEPKHLHTQSAGDLQPYAAQNVSGVVRRARFCSSAMLSFIILLSLFSQGHAVDYGTDFVTVFPENLAYYYPLVLNLKLKITTLLPSTTVKVTINGTEIPLLSSALIDPPQVIVVPISNGNYEVDDFGVCNNTVRITSDKNITVVAISKRGDSLQANMVPPTTHLGQEYLIPALNYTDYAIKMNNYSSVQYSSTSNMLMDFSYRLIIINAVESANTITVTEQPPNGAPTTTKINLAAFEMTQLPSSSYWFKVSASAKVAVILTNPCIDSAGCKCNMISHQIRPIEYLGVEFIYPQLNETSKLFVTAGTSVILTCDGKTNTVDPGSINLLPYLPDAATSDATLKTSVPSSLRVIRPGLIIDLLPKTMFAGCFLVHKHTANVAYALVIVEEGKETDVYLDSTAATASWTPITGTHYVSGNITITAKSSVIWHLSSKIGVYIFESLVPGVFTGGPAITLNNEPDPNGCLLVPMEFELSNTTMSWQASRAQCSSKGMLLASPNINYNQKTMVTTLNRLNADGVAWLGLRRNLVTSEWYWHKEHVTFNYSNWENNQPAGGLCVSMKMEPNGNYTWSTVRCCSLFLPLCVRDMVLLNTVTDASQLSPFI